MPHSFQIALRDIYAEGCNRHPHLSDSLDKISTLLETTAIPRQDHIPHDNPLSDHLSRYLKDTIEVDAFRVALNSVENRHSWAELSELDTRFEGFSSHFSYSEIIGPEGMFKHEDLNVGIMVQAPNFFYAPHFHDSVELYLILSGTAYWKKGEDPWLPRKSSEWVLHERNQIHAMRTGDEPLIALYAWYGGPTSPVEFTNEDFHGLPQ